MTTQRLSYDWRIPTAGLMLLAILVAGFTLHSHWNAFIQWCLATQITLHRYLVMYLLQLNNHQYSGGLWLLAGAFSSRPESGQRLRRGGRSHNVHRAGAGA